MRSPRRLYSLLLALSVTITAGAADGAAAAGSTRDLTLDATIQGVIERVVVDHAPDHGHDEAGHHRAEPGRQPSGLVTKALVRAGDRLLSVPSALDRGLADGARVRVRLAARPSARPASWAAASGPGHLVDVQPLPGAAGRPAQLRRAASGPAAYATGTDGAVLGRHELTVLPVHWSTPDDQSVAHLTRLAQDTADYWAEQSRGQISVTAAVRGWRRIADPGGCREDVLLERALAAHGLAAPTSARQHVLVYFPQRADCDWAGLGSLGGSFMWVNGYPLVDVVAHEFGHNLGLGHANAATCHQAAARVAFGAACQVQEYQDRADVMGLASYERTGNLNAALADALGLVPVQQVSAGAAGPVTVDLAAPTGEGTRALKIAVGAGEVFVDFRPAAGRDVRRPDWAGVQVHYRPDGDYPQSQLLDMQPWTAQPFAAVSLPQWAVWPVPGAGVSVVVTALGPDRAQVRVLPTAGDGVPPSAAVVALARTEAGDLDVSWSAATDAGSGVSAYAVTVDGAVLRRTGPDVRRIRLRPPAGARAVRVDAVDAAGNTTAGAPVAVADAGAPGPVPADPPREGVTDPGTVSEDTSPPGAVALLGPARGAALPGALVDLRWRAASDPESGVVGYRIVVDGVPLPGMVAGHRAAAQIGLADGRHVLGVAAVNGVGLLGPRREVPVVVDTHAPAAPRRLTAGGDGYLRWQRPRDVGSPVRFRVRVDGGATVTTASARVRTDLPQLNAARAAGRHVWCVRAVDAAGNASASSCSTLAVPGAAGRGD